jgi:hypothetical protein
MEITKLRLAMEIIGTRAGEEGNNGVGILLQHGAGLMESFNGIVDGLKTFFTATPSTAFLPDDYKRVEKTLHNVSYGAITNIGMPVPEGFKGDLIGYASYLQKSVDACSEVNIVLDDLYRVVSVCLTNPTMPQETSLPGQQKEKKIGVEELKKEATKFFDPNSSNTNLPFGKVIRRNSDWPLVVRETTALEEALARFNKKILLEKAKKLDVVIEKLIKQRKNKPEFAIDTAWLKYVAEQTYHIAVMLEFSAVTYYRCLAYFQSVDSISQKLIAATKN